MRTPGRSHGLARWGLLSLALVVAVLSGAGATGVDHRPADLSAALGAATSGEPVGSTVAVPPGGPDAQEAAPVRTASPPIVPVTPRANTGSAVPDDATTTGTSGPEQSTSASATSPATSSAPGATAPSSRALDVPGWSLLFSEDFDQDAALGQFASVYPGWAGYDGGRDTSASYGRSTATQGRYDSATTTSVHDGVVDEHLHTAAGAPQVVALTPTPDGAWWGGQTYGRYAVRFRADAVPGYKLAFLLWPSSDTWSDGEIDFPEGSLDGDIGLYSHDVTGDPSSNAFSADTGTGMSDWHTAVIEWTPGRLTYRLDDRSWTTTDPTAVPSSPMRWVLQTETELSSAAPDPGVSGHVLIDWVAAWRPA